MEGGGGARAKKARGLGDPAVLKGFRTVRLAVGSRVPLSVAKRLNESVPFTVPVTKKTPELTAVPPAVVTAINPEVPPVGTVAVIEVPVFAVTIIGIPARVTPVAPVKFVPVMVTVCPTARLAGENPEIAGTKPPGGVTVKLVALVAIPSRFATVIHQRATSATAVFFL